ncbi:diacylglycerol kinase [Flavobacterium cyanobacteriorum]|uniref:Diacylglycerol kinase n=1 Tax=Flavobacterium cyanobacteriorum TaxID=2022802 RepID=A0A255ZUB4_9FLAO|nr:YegS/Rv2252/BmrU family lipid kinase [Flavobacterium cyanobacteriorum]OYQ44350.1 diacylglycerol kinase [Flavobacterium cyanobacteriorum]
MSSQKKFLFVVNPIAGGNDKSALIEATHEYARKEGVTLIEFYTTGEDDEAAIKKLYEEHKPERILVAGGDGTIKMAAEAVQHNDVIIGVLPAGSANGLSVDLDLPNSLEENLRIAFHNHYIEMDMVSINGRKSLHLSDIGLNAELIKNYENSNIRGKLGYALQAVNTLSTTREPFDVTIKANGETINTEARMVVIANTNRYGTGVTINPIGKMDDGKFEIVVLKNLDIIVISKILAGNIPVDSENDVEILSAEEAEITTGLPVFFQVDGEYCGEEQQLSIKILPKQMKVAIP